MTGYPNYDNGIDTGVMLLYQDEYCHYGNSIVSDLTPDEKERLRLDNAVASVERMVAMGKGFTDRMESLRTRQALLTRKQMFSESGKMPKRIRRIRRNK